MREFRVWCENKNEWEKDDMFLAQSGYLLHRVHGSNFRAVKKETHIIEFYTGLLSKNGNKLFEGDRIRIPAKNKWEEKNYSTFEIFYHDNDCAPGGNVGLKIGRMKNHGSVAGGFSGYGLIPETTAKFEICGNIHE